jgi:hypothetical protein
MALKKELQQALSLLRSYAVINILLKQLAKKKFSRGDHFSPFLLGLKAIYTQPELMLDPASRPLSQVLAACVNNLTAKQLQNAAIELLKKFPPVAITLKAAKTVKAPKASSKTAAKSPSALKKPNFIQKAPAKTTRAAKPNQDINETSPTASVTRKKK